MFLKFNFFTISLFFVCSFFRFSGVGVSSGVVGALAMQNALDGDGGGNNNYQTNEQTNKRTKKQT